MNTTRTIHRRNLLIYVMIIVLICTYVFGRLIYIMVFQSEYYSNGALEVQQRERAIKAPRGQILDRNGKIIASNKTVCTVSVIYNQIKEPEKVIDVLSKELDMDSEEIRKKVTKRSSREKIKSNVSKEIGDKIRECKLDGVKVDEDYKRYYPYSDLCSKVLGFTGGDNQGIIGLEVKYEEYLKGTNGTILTPTDAKGVEQENALEQRVEPIAGNDLVTTIDLNIQQYAQQIAYNALKAKQANYVSIIVMNPNNGEILAMVNAPEFDLNNPYELIDMEEYENEETTENNDTENEETTKKSTDKEMTEKEKQDALNQMWRNQSINDTYEPGSTFKVVTATAALEENLVNLDTTFNCPGFKYVEDRKIRCHKTQGHGAETFVEGTMNSCNPVFIEVGLKVGTQKFYKYLNKLGILGRTNIDLPGEASTIIHDIKNVGNVELATMSFGQSFQITPIQYLRATSAIINGGTLVTPHFAKKALNSQGELVEEFQYNKKENVISKETSETMKYILEKVVSEGTGSKGKVEGFSIGGKTATSQKLPRNSGKYIASYMGFAPADNPQVIAMAIVDEPEGMYYGGQVAAPLISKLYENILPYMLEEKQQGE